MNPFKLSPRRSEAVRAASTMPDGRQLMFGCLLSLSLSLSLSRARARSFSLSRLRQGSGILEPTSIRFHKGTHPLSLSASASASLSFCLCLAVSHYLAVSLSVHVSVSLYLSLSLSLSLCLSLSLSSRQAPGVLEPFGLLLSRTIPKLTSSLHGTNPSTLERQPYRP